MISYLEGRISEVETDSLTIDVGGIGYMVYVPASVFPNLPQARESVKIYTHHYFREDGQNLYGFLTKKDKEIFRRLITVSGVGPKVALAMMSALPADKLVEAIALGDPVYLSSVPGVGKKTAERIILELRGKLSDLAVELETPLTVAGPGVEPSIKEDTIAALITLGYSARDVQRVINTFTEADLHRIRTAEDSIKLVLQRIK